MKKILFLLFISTFLCTHLYSQKNGLIIRGVPFSLRSWTYLTEEKIDSINTSDRNKLTYYHTISSKSQILKLKSLLIKMVAKKIGTIEGYELRMGLCFGKSDEEKFYFDVSQRLVYQGKVYKSTKTEIKNVFCLICQPEFIKSLNGITENRYWKYSPICK